MLGAHIYSRRQIKKLLRFSGFRMFSNHDNLLLDSVGVWYQSYLLDYWYKFCIYYSEVLQNWDKVIETIWKKDSVLCFHDSTAKNMCNRFKSAVNTH